MVHWVFCLTERDETPEHLRATFVTRPNRFLAVVLVDGERHYAYVPNPGRMHELMTPGKRVWVRRENAVLRKTGFTVVAVEHDGVLVSIDSLLPNRFMKQVFEERLLPEFGDYETVIPEPRLFEGRADFLLSGPSGRFLVEVKSCTLVVSGWALFPDAVTARGARHLRDLARALEQRVAERVAVVFVVQRPDAHAFAPNDPTDPAFGDSFRDSVRRGLEAIALRTELREWSLHLLGHIPVHLSPPSDLLASTI